MSAPCDPAVADLLRAARNARGHNEPKTANTNELIALRRVAFLVVSGATSAKASAQACQAYRDE